jgi:hypothetical protein
MVRSGRQLSDPLFLAAMLFGPCLPLLEDGSDAAAQLDKIIDPLIAPLPFTRRHMAYVRQIILAQRRLWRGPRSRRDRRILDRDFAADAIDLLDLVAVTQPHEALAKEWREAVALRHTGEIPAPAPAPRPRRRRRPRGGKAGAAEAKPNGQES